MTTRSPRTKRWCRGRSARHRSSPLGSSPVITSISTITGRNWPTTSRTRSRRVVEAKLATVRTRLPRLGLPTNLFRAEDTQRRPLGPAGPDGAIGARHVATGGLHLRPVGVGPRVDHLEATAQLGDELLAGHRAGTTPEVPGGQHIANDGLVLGLQRGRLCTDEGAVGVDIAELVIDRHIGVLLKSEG